MAITLISGSTVTKAGFVTGTPLTILASALTIADGDLLLAFIGKGQTGAGATSLPTGFTEIDSTTYAGDATTRQVVFGYKYASSESGDYDFTTTDASATNQNHGGIAVYRGVAATNPLDVTYVRATHAIELTDDQLPTAQPITTVTDNAWVLLIHSPYLAAGSDPIQETVTGYTEDTWGDVTVGTYGRAGQILHKEVATAGVETPGNWTSYAFSALDSWTATIALKPAAGDVTAPLVLYTSPGLSVTNP